MERLLQLLSFVSKAVPIVSKELGIISISYECISEKNVIIFIRNCQQTVLLIYREIHLKVDESSAREFHISSFIKFLIYS